MCVIASVTRFGEILPLWQNLKETWLSFESLFRKILNLLDKSFSIWQNLIVENSQPLNKQSINLVTLSFPKLHCTFLLFSFCMY